MEYFIIIYLVGVIIDMTRKILFALILVFSVLFLTNAVCAMEVKTIDSNDTSTSNIVSSSKNHKSFTGPIKKVSTSKSTFKAGTKVKIEVTTTKSIKSVSVSISGKKGYKHKLKKSGTRLWHGTLETKGLRSGKYKLNVNAFSKKAYKRHVFLTVDNVPPRVRLIKSNSTRIIAGTPFFIEAVADKTSRKVIVEVRGKTFRLKASPMVVNRNGFNSSNSKNWTSNTKLSYKEIGTLKVNVYVYDSVGNFVKRTLNIRSNPRYVYWNGTVLNSSPVRVHYPNPVNDYQRAVNLLSKHVNVYEGYANGTNTLGITYHNGYRVTKVVIAYKDPFVVYHEMAHVLNWRWSEYQCDVYAYERVGYWIL